MPQTSKRVYLDYAATAPFDERLFDVLKDASWANANALYAEGKEAASQLRDARKRIAAALGAHAPSEITFTSGGTESDNMAIKGLARPVSGANKTHVVVSAIEHDAVLKAADSLKAYGFKVTHLAPDSCGIITEHALEETLARIESAGDAACLVAIQAVNNELGTIQPVRELAKCAHAHQALFFSDAVQALGKIPIDLEESGVDACAFSAHKIGALKGCGALYVRRGVRLPALIHGGGQEAGLRSGTSNVMGALAFVHAVKYAVSEREYAWDHATDLRTRLLDGIARCKAVRALTPTIQKGAPCVPHIVSLLCDGLEGETLVLRLDNAGFAVSSGSACSSGSLDPSHVLTSIGIPKAKAYGSLRLSFGRASTTADIDAFLSVLPEVLS